MNTTMVFLLAFTAGIVGFVIGDLLRFFRDSKYIKEIMSIYEDLISKIKDVHSKEIEDYRKAINRYSAIEALRNTRAVHVTPFEPSQTEWIDVDFTAPDDGGLDFPNSKED